MFKRSLTFVIAAALSMSAIAPTAFADDDPTSTALSSKGDAAKGKRVFNRCKACHILAASGPKKLGPSLGGIFGRKAGSLDGYKYSKALAEADFVWTEEKLDQWLAQPKTFLPGNKMTFMGLRKEDQRQDLMAYLREAASAE
ncbi:cytochrome c [Kordiimonas sediminis]|uniref:Cytochrome c n=1 Tax=Kordiimonas sediminis TaxID=1735581 RepID=A0A919AU08_9PROT|nr:cytochrome c family protein [Kordiimonas sediminis]GHF26227.1 cytochrome c [Kordiimonas sediminis]